MSFRIVPYDEIDRTEWGRLVRESETGTWFQSPEAFDFLSSMPELFSSFCIAVEKSELKVESGKLKELRGVCVGYVTKERSTLKQYFTRRAIINGGLVLADDCSEAEVIALLEAIKTKTRHLQSLDSDLPETTPQSACMHASRQSEDLSRVADEQPDASQKHAALTKNTKNRLRNLSPIYIETRNFNDYSKWREAFERAGFEYKRHLNFHVDCGDEKAMWERLSENRKRQIRKGERLSVIGDGLREEDIREWYGILEKLYRTKVKTPLWPVEFFLEAYRQGVGKFLLVKHEEKVIGGSMVVVLTSERMNELTNERRGTVYEWFECGMNAEYKEQYPSVMATWAGMQLAHETGCKRYDMMGAGEPGVPYGVRDFKSEFGGTMVEHGRFLCVTKPILYRLGVFAVRLLKRIK